MWWVNGPIFLFHPVLLWHAQGQLYLHECGRSQKENEQLPYYLTCILLQLLRTRSFGLLQFIIEDCFVSVGFDSLGRESAHSKASKLQKKMHLHRKTRTLDYHIEVWLGFEFTVPSFERFRWMYCRSHDLCRAFWSVGSCKLCVFVVCLCVLACILWFCVSREYDNIILHACYTSRFFLQSS